MKAQHFQTCVSAPGPGQAPSQENRLLDRTPGKKERDEDALACPGSGQQPYYVLGPKVEDTKSDNVMGHWFSKKRAAGREWTGWSMGKESVWVHTTHTVVYLLEKMGKLWGGELQASELQGPEY